MTDLELASDAMSPVDNTFERRSMTFPCALVSEVERATFELRRAGCRVSFSSFVEVALRELVANTDLRSVLERHGACVRRPSGARAARRGGER